MVEFAGFEACVETKDGSKLKEYPYPDKEPKDTKTVYIEIPTSLDEPVPFVTRAAIMPFTPIAPNHKLRYAVDYRVDGVTSFYSEGIAEGFGTHRHMCLFKGLYSTTTAPSGTEEVILRETVFQRLETTEEDNDDDDKDLADLGSITVGFWKVLSMTPVQANDAPPKQHQKPQKSLPVEGKINEKRLKGTSSSHSVGLGEEISRNNTSQRQQYKTTYSPTPIAIIRFLYRSKASLQSLGIIPSDDIPPPPQSSAPPPPHLKRERDETNLLDDRKVKKERPEAVGSNDRARSCPNLKREPGIKQEREKRAGRRRFQVVDLTQN